MRYPYLVICLVVAFSAVAVTLVTLAKAEETARRIAASHDAHVRAELCKMLGECDY